MNFTPKNAENLICEICDFKCCKRSDWNRHILTSKHKNRTQSNILEQENGNNGVICKEQFQCKTCFKTYAARNSLWYHEKKCKNNCPKNEIVISKDENETKILSNIVVDLIKQNQELIDIMKNNIGHNTIHNNSHNKTFN